MQLVLELMPRRCLSIVFLEDESDNFEDGLTVEEWDTCVDDGYDDPDLEFHPNGKGIIVPRGTFTIIAGDEKLHFRWDGRRLTDDSTGYVFFEKEISKFS